MMRNLNPEQIKRLGYVMGQRRCDVITLRNMMDAPFSYRTLQAALSGKSIRESTYEFIAKWLDRFVPAEPAAKLRRGKDAAAGETEEDSESIETAHTRLRSDPQ